MALDIDLKGRQFAEFQEALQHAFPGYNDLELMLMHKLGAALPNISPPLNPLPKVVYDLIVWAKAKGLLSDLMAGALEANPGNPYLRRIALGVAVTSDESLSTLLESRVLKSVPFLKSPETGVTHWRQKMHEAERCVCRVEIPAQVAMGTGFLVAPDIVMTNWHVAKLVIDRAVRPEQVALRFDYKADPSGQPMDGPTYVLAEDWLIEKSSEKELDYGLVRLAAKTEDGRGRLKPQAYDFPPNHPLFILQHPDGELLNVQVGSILSVNKLHKRINYTTNTAGGSSGSPCFTMSWEAVALHHVGQDTSNMGIPLTAIAEDVQQRNPNLATELGW